MDQLVRSYSCKRKRNRWPMTFFSNILDVAGIAALVVWLAKNPNWNINKHYRRRLYLKELGNELVSGHLQRRLETPQALQAGVRRAMIDIGLLPSRPTANTRPPPATGKRRCQICPRMEDKKVITKCVYCEIHCCPRHHSIMCDVCITDHRGDGAAWKLIKQPSMWIACALSDRGRIKRYRLDYIIAVFGKSWM